MFSYCIKLDPSFSKAYSFRADARFQLGNVKNGAGLPLFPFRTDNW